MGALCRCLRPRHRHEDVRRLCTAQRAAAQVRLRARAGRRSGYGTARTQVTPQGGRPPTRGRRGQPSVRTRNMAGRQDQLGSTASQAQNESAAAVAPPCAMVIFGAAGDLTKRLVVPSLYNLVRAKRLSDGFQLVGLDLAAMTATDWRQRLSDTMSEFAAQGGGEFEADHIDQAAWRWLADRMSYLQGDLTDPATYRRLGEHLARLDKTAGTAGNHLFYLAVADRFFGTAVEGLAAAGLVTEEDRQWRRVVIEKPFGHDLASAQALNAQILKLLQVRQIYRMGHFLGKETVQNIMALRFANGLF